MLSRRETLAWLLRALAVAAAPTDAQVPQRADPPPWADAGYGRDPPLIDPRRPWPLTLTSDQLAAVARLSDLLLPADDRSPAASTLGIPAFIDEWVSAPYPSQRADRLTILGGLRWLDQHARGAFATLDAMSADELLRSICDVQSAVDRTAADFFACFRRVCLIGYYTTDEGRRDLGYVGDQPSDRFAGPPADVLARLGLE